MNPTPHIESIISDLFIQTDRRNWNGLHSIFSDTVILDYSSFGAGTAKELTSQEITNSWKSVLPGFESTHHQIGNFITRVSNNKAEVFCYGTASHYLNDEKGNVWTVIGSYNFELENKNKQWKVTTMKFNFKFQDGNKELIQKAIANVKPQKS